MLWHPCMCTQICHGLGLRHSKHALKSMFDHPGTIYNLKISIHAFSWHWLTVFRCCCLAPMFFTKDVCSHLRGFQGGNAAQCAERSNTRHAWSTTRHNSSDTSVPPGTFNTSWWRVNRPSSLKGIPLETSLCVCVCLESKRTGEATTQENGSKCWENSAAQKTNTCGANSLKKRWV